MLPEFAVLSQATYFGIAKNKLIRDSLKVLNHEKYDYGTISQVIDILTFEKLLQQCDLSFYCITPTGKSAYTHDYEQLRFLIKELKPK